MTDSTTDDLLNAGKSRVVPFKGLEEFGLTLHCGPISEAESADHEASHWKPGTTTIDPIRLKSSRRKLLAMTVCDSTGKRLLNEEQAGKLDSRLAGMLYEQASEHVKPGPPKNSKAASEDDSPSDSRPTADGPTSTSSSAS